MKENISPEEKLLRLIRGEKELGESQSKSKFTPQRSSRIKPVPSKRYGIEHVKKIFFGIFLISLAYLVIILVFNLVPKRAILVSIPTEEVEIEEGEIKQQVKPFDFYLEATNKKQIFSSESPEITKPTETGDLRGTELIRELNLLGIISGEDPQAIIEDKKIHKTYFLRKGDFVSEFQVEEIGEGKVTLSHQGQKFDLFL